MRNILVRSHPLREATGRRGSGTPWWKLCAGLAAAMLVLSASGRGSAALPDKCSSLTKDQKALADSIMAKNYSYDCCDETIAKCLAKKKRCKLAVRLAGEICSRAAKGETQDKIEGALSRRAKSMMPKIDTSGLDTWLGAKESKVLLAAYICTRCPYCSKLMPKVHKAVTEGSLKGKVRLYIRIFPLKTHPGSAEGGFALAAAAKMGKFWPFLLKFYKNFDKFKVEALPAWAKEAGMDEAQFKSIMNSPETKSLVVQSKKEGLKNGVEGTPTFFISGRKYFADQEMEYFGDALEEEYDRAAGEIYQ
jgi:protein-disulfide isomerase